MMKEKLFDRLFYQEILQKRVSSLKDGYRQNIALIGDESVGKSSIVFKFLDNFCDNRFMLIYIEVRHEPLSDFAKRFTATLLYNFLINSQIPLKEDLDFLISKSQRYIPQTIVKIKQIIKDIKKRKTTNIFTELFMLPELIHQETGKHCVIFLDEFHNLENLGIKTLYREWSKLLILQKNTLYVIISSLKYKTGTILAKDLSLLFGNFEVVNIEPFDVKTSEKIIITKLKGREINPGLKNFLVHFAGGYPFYLEVIAESFAKSLPQQEPCEVLEHLLFDASGILNQRFSNYIKRFQDIPNTNDYILILYLISCGRNKLKDIAHIMRIKKEDLNLRLSRLLEIDAVSRCGDFLKINDKVFSFWLRFVYQERLNTLSFDAKNQKEKLRDRINEMIDEFLREAQKPLTERMSELLHLFEDEILQVEKKKIRLSHFREIKKLELNNHEMKEGLIGRSSDCLWIVAFKQSALTEEDITYFSKECKKYRHKMQRKILISLDEIDANAKLRAMEEKIWTWDIGKLNQMLELYSRTPVVL